MTLINYCNRMVTRSLPTQEDVLKNVKNHLNSIYYLKKRLIQILK